MVEEIATDVQTEQTVVAVLDEVLCLYRLTSESIPREVARKYTVVADRLNPYDVYAESKFPN